MQAGTATYTITAADAQSGSWEVPVSFRERMTAEYSLVASFEVVQFAGTYVTQWYTYGVAKLTPDGFSYYLQAGSLTEGDIVRVHYFAEELD